MNTIPTCFICSQRVIGLRGQDVTLDTFYLKGEEDDEKALAENAFGDCHLLCLTRSNWGSFWAQRVAENLRDTRKFKCVLEGDDWQILRNARMAETILIRSDGWFKFQPDSGLREARSTPEGLSLPVQEEMNVELSGHADLIAELKRPEESRGPYSLWKFTERLGVSGHLLYPDAIRSGEILPTQSGERREWLRVVKGRTFLFATFFYDDFIPGDLAEPLLQIRDGDGA